MQRSLVITVISLCLALVTGCDTGTGALSGAGIGGLLGGLAARRNPVAGALLGAAAGAIVGGTIGHINEEQRARLEAQSPQTWYVIQHNQALAQQPPPLPPPPPPVSEQPAVAYAPPPPSGQPAAAPTTSQPTPAAPAADAPIPLKVDDIKAMTAAGIKAQAIIDAIKESKGSYTDADIQAAQQANPPVDAAVIACMKNPAA